MAIEQKRGCGYRKVGGLYMVGGLSVAPCDRLPFKLDVCQCCGEGFRPARSLRQIMPPRMLQGDHAPCSCSMACYVCHPDILSQTAGHYLEWVGQGFYKDPADFVEEAKRMGISRRISAVPRDLVVGETVVFLAHRNVLVETLVASKKSDRTRWTLEETAAIFHAFKVSKLEFICRQSDFDLLQEYLSYPEEDPVREEFDEAVIKLARTQARGITLVPVPDDDPDHQ